MAGGFFQLDSVCYRPQLAQPFENKPFHAACHAQTSSAVFGLVRGKTQSPISSIRVERGLNFWQTFHFHPLASLKVEDFGWGGLDNLFFSWPRLSLKQP